MAGGRKEQQLARWVWRRVMDKPFETICADGQLCAGYGGGSDVGKAGVAVLKHQSKGTTTPAKAQAYFFTDDSLTINSDLIIIVSVDLAEACPAI